MPPSFTYPGVYVSERESGARAVPAAATSIAMFIGMADMGPIGDPKRIQSLDDFQRTFGETAPGELALQVQQFFLNGGGETYVMRIANGPAAAAITLRNQAGNPVLTLTARSQGEAGNALRAEVDYDTPSPGRTFNLTVYRANPRPDGSVERLDSETISNLSMDPASPRFVENQVEAQSNLVTASSAVAAVPGNGVSVGGNMFSGAPGVVRAAMLNDLGAGNIVGLRVSVAHRQTLDVSLDMSTIGADTMQDFIRDAINDAYADAGTPLASPVTGELTSFPTGPAGTRFLEFRCADGPVVFSPAAANDATGVLGLGVASGGAEFDAYSEQRPVQSGVGLEIGTNDNAADQLSEIASFGDSQRDAITGVRVTDPGFAEPFFNAVALSGTPTDRILQSDAGAPGNRFGSLDQIRRALDEIATAMTAAASAGWSVRREGLGLVARPVGGDPAAVGPGVAVEVGQIPDATTAVPPASLIGMDFDDNVAAYSLGSGGSGSQGDPVPGDNGTTPQLGDYTDAFDVIREEVEIFNIMALPRADGQSDTDRQALWGAASSFCAEQRAILLVDPYSSWSGIEDAESGADTIKLGVDTRHSAAYWPRVLVPVPSNTAGIPIDPCGSMAGLYARTDTRFGTWRAPAGIQATLTGVVGVEHPMGDMANGIINPKALNAIRLFPSGITSWGARTMVGADDTGNVDDKYINVRRMMLFIENSLYRGLRFAVFRNNAEPLWAQIRLAAGSFMNSLMLQGAFATQTKDTAYYVQCDSSTTTPTDVNLGIVNVVVGFAPNKPAEFVHLTVTQIAGQTDV